MTTASYISLTRIFLIIPIIYFSSLQITVFNIFALVLFIIASLSDYLDGYVARKMNSVTYLGSLLDLLADKLLVCLVLIWLSFLNSSFPFIFAVILIVSREIIISSIRQFISENYDSKLLKVSLLGKVKTVLQMFTISVILISPECPVFLSPFSIILLWITAFVSFYSLIQYVQNWSRLIDSN